ncbi:MAG: sugar ABC transporter substrate-binding protein [Dictyoglomi bacterium]|nr:sugar ABC transporter substrate-binding protein [Dictyoglomota bacterium]
MKKFSVVLLVSIFVFMLSTYGFAAETITLLWRVNPNEHTMLQNLVKAFEEKYPDIQVKVIEVPQPEYEPKLSSMFAAGDPPDVFSSVGWSGFIDFVLRDMALDLTPFIKRDKFDTKDFYPQSIKGMSYGGKIMGLPLGGGPSLMYYNIDLFNETGLPPIPTNWDDNTWTWDKMLEYAQKLTKRDDSGRITQFGVNMSLWPVDAYSWLWGGSWFPSEAYKTGLTDKSYVNSPAVIKSLQNAADLIHKYHISPTRQEAQMFQQFIDPFVSGKIGMGATGAWFFQNFSVIKNFKWSVGALPKGTTRKDVLFSDPWIIAKTSKHPEAAWNFVKWTLSKEGQEVLMKGYVSFSLRPSLFYTVEQKAPNVPKDKLKEAILGAIKYSQESSNHIIANWSAIERLANAELDPMWLGKATAKEVVKSLQPKLDKLLKDTKEQYTK